MTLQKDKNSANSIKSVSMLSRNREQGSGFTAEQRNVPEFDLVDSGSFSISSYTVDPLIMSGLEEVRVYLCVLV